MLKRTTSADSDFVLLRTALDEELWQMYPIVMNDYWEHNLLPETTPALVYYQNGHPVACGAFKAMPGLQAIEVKRMFVAHSARGQDLGGLILAELEAWGLELGYSRAILETGLKNYAAHKLYERNGYERIDNYEPFVGMAESWCYGKSLKG